MIINMLCTAIIIIIHGYLCEIKEWIGMVWTAFGIVLSLTCYSLIMLHLF